MTPTLSDVIAECERASEGGAMLEARIYVEMKPSHWWKHGGDHIVIAQQMAGSGFIPRYTRSLDAAMTLGENAQERAYMLSIAIAECRQRRLDVGQHGARFASETALRMRLRARAILAKGETK